MATRTGKEPMFTAGKVAKELGIPASNVKKLILDRKIQPDLIKGGCSYYSAATVKKIRDALG